MTLFFKKGFEDIFERVILRFEFSGLLQCAATVLIYEQVGDG